MTHIEDIISGKNYGSKKERVICADGVSLSVQAEEYAYCIPHNDYGPYTHLEVGFVSVTPPESWADYGETGLHSDVYPYVPVDMVLAFIESHGGDVTLAQ